MLYYDWIQQGAVWWSISGKNAWLDLETRPVEWARLAVHGIFQQLSDANLQRATSGELMYHVPGTAWTWIGLGWNLISFANQDGNYWQPSRFRESARASSPGSRFTGSSPAGRW